MSPNLGFRTRCAMMSSCLHKWYGGCAGSGLKLISVFTSVLWMYDVEALFNVRLVVVLSRVLILVMRVSLVGVVSPSMFSTVPKCFVYVGVLSLRCESVVSRVCVVIVASTGHCRSKFNAKLVNGGMGCVDGALCMLTWHLLLFRPSLTTNERSPARSM